ncbi:hypothetical protein O2K51_03650 [Apibacter raozihei]|uniref:hypothetical protein n=1 Tax=Apibacter raozihei TaxID=2500547 RepID=UPI0013E2FBE9|nr:hypothetical protein [Apibacter raozihei]
MLKLKYIFILCLFCIISGCATTKNREKNREYEFQDEMEIYYEYDYEQYNYDDFDRG